MASKNADKMALGPRNIKFMIAGLLVMAAGFLLLSGCRASRPAVFNYALFAWRRPGAAPMGIVAGIVLEIVAIMGRFKEEE